MKRTYLEHQNGIKTGRGVLEWKKDSIKMEDCQTRNWKRSRTLQGAQNELRSLEVELSYCMVDVARATVAHLLN